MKGEIDLAGKTLSLYQSSLVTVRKSRRSYKQTCDDVVEQERDVERLRADPLREQELKKVEHKLKKTRVHMDHMSKWRWGVWSSGGEWLLTAVYMYMSLS